MAKLWGSLLCSVNGVGFARTIAENGALGEIELPF
jgi:hypothetical protein